MANSPRNSKSLAKPLRSLPKPETWWVSDCTNWRMYSVRVVAMNSATVRTEDGQTLRRTSRAYSVHRDRHEAGANLVDRAIEAALDACVVMSSATQAFAEAVALTRAMLEGAAPDQVGRLDSELRRVKFAWAGPDVRKHLANREAAAKKVGADAALTIVEGINQVECH